MARPFKFNPEQLEQKYQEYKEWIKTQYFERPEMIKSGDRAGEVIYIKVYTPPTIVHFCHFAGLDFSSFYDYINADSDNIDEKLTKTATRIHKDIADTMQRGANAGIYNQSITARLTGLADKFEVQHSGEQNSINIQIDGSEIKLK